MIYKILFLILLFISTLSGFLGFYQSDLLFMEISVMLGAVLCFFLREKSPSICLISSLIISISGILLGANSIFMILYCGFSLASWEITLMELQFSGNTENTNVKLYNTMRFISLGSTLLISFILIFILRFINFKIPFFIIIISVIFSFFCISRIIDIFKKKMK